jgi:hypothetical protein
VKRGRWLRREAARRRGRRRAPFRVLFAQSWQGTIGEVRFVLESMGFRVSW